MSGREWKPGDVALVTMRSRADGREVSGGPAVAIRDNVGSWACGAATVRCLSDSDTLSARPLVVIDPEDRDQVERVYNAYVSQGGLAYAAFRLDYMQAALRSLIEPPKPDEPTGLGAVVETSADTQYIRIGNGPKPWMILGGSPASRDYTYAYADINVVRVLSEGVQS